jgi:hypothetical protein
MLENFDNFFYTINRSFWLKMPKIGRKAPKSSQKTMKFGFTNFLELFEIQTEL